MKNQMNGHGNIAALDDETCHARFPHPNPLPQAGEGANESLREFHAKEMNCCLTLVCHSSLEERLADQLLEHHEWVAGFSMFKMEGGSQREILSSKTEQVRGRSQRVAFQAVMNLDDAHALVAHLKREENNPEMSYWITPVIEFGRLV